MLQDRNSYCVMVSQWWRRVLISITRRRAKFSYSKGSIWAGGWLCGYGDLLRRLGVEELTFNCINAWVSCSSLASSCSMRFECSEERVCTVSLRLVKSCSCRLVSVPLSTLGAESKTHRRPLITNALQGGFVFRCFGSCLF